MEFRNVDIKEVPLNLGQFQVVFLTDEINELDDPESLLKNVHRYVEAEGLLIVYTDYSWNRTTNQVSVSHLCNEALFSSMIIVV